MPVLSLTTTVIFALMHLCPIKGSVFSVKSEQLEVCRLAVQLCGMEHRFGGDAAAVQTGAADIPAFNQERWLIQAVQHG